MRENCPYEQNFEESTYSFTPSEKRGGVVKIHTDLKSNILVGCSEVSKEKE